MEARNISNAEIKKPRMQPLIDFFSFFKRKRQPVSISTESLEDFYARIRFQETTSLVSGYGNRAIFAFLGALTNYLYELKPHYESLNDDMKKLVKLLRDIYLHARVEAVAFESERPEFQIDIDLHDQKNQYLTLDQKVEGSYQLAMLAHHLAERKLRTEIDDLDQRIVEVSMKQILGELKDLELYGKIHQEIQEQLEVADMARASITCMQRLFCYTPDSIKRAYRQINELERRRTILDADDIDKVRDALVSRLEENRRQKYVELDQLSTKEPVRDDQHRQAYINIEAHVRSEEFAYYSQINHALMLDMLKLQFVIDKIYRSLLEQTGDVAFEDANVNAGLQNAKELFGRLKESFKSLSSSFYCKEPGKYYFSHYLNNRSSIKDNNVLDLSQPPGYFR